MTECLETAYIIPNIDEPIEEPTWAACLIVLEGAYVGDRILLDKDEITIGRAKDMDVCFAQDDGVSRAHAVIQRVENEENFLIIDKNSVNGTFVNSKKIKITSLADQDLITIGENVLKFVSSTSPEQAHYDELYRQTHLDRMLQIYNKQYFLTKLEEEVNRCQRYKTELSLVLFDIDHFKKINDIYGHLAGDAALVHLTGIVKQRVRETDILCRYGGEEFAIIMPHVSLQQAYILAEHMRTLVAKTPINHDNSTIAMTISLGISCYDLNTAEPCSRESLIAQADKALYQAKQGGRNKVAVFNFS